MPAVAATKLIDEVPEAVAAAGFWVRVGLAGPAVCVQVQVGAGSEELVAVMVTGAPAVTVWFWIGLMLGPAAAATVIVVLAVEAPQEFVAVKARL